MQTKGIPLQPQTLTLATCSLLILFFQIPFKRLVFFFYLFCVMRFRYNTSRTSILLHSDGFS